MKDLVWKKDGKGESADPAIMAFPLRYLFDNQAAVMDKVTDIVYRTIATHLTRKPWCANTTAQTGAVTLIQRSGGVLNLNIYFHMLFLEECTSTTPMNRSLNNCRFSGIGR